jgi:2,4-dichlorophenol 6-monooxygenase
MTDQELEVDVLVVGTGPTGATAALALATHGVRVHVVSRWNWLANSPRAHITNQRALEVLRDLGVEEEATKQATPWDLMGDTVWTTSLAGDEVARLRTWGTGDERHGDYVKGSPCPLLDLPQTYLEPVLVKNAAERGASFSFNTEYEGHVQDDAGITATCRDRLTGRQYTIRAKYLVGADGSRSRIVEELGLKLEGQLARAATAYVLFNADLSRYVEHRPSILYWVMTPSTAFGEIGMATLRAIRPWTKWIAGWGYDMTQGEPDLSDDVVKAKIRGIIGEPHIDLDIEAKTTWHVNQAYATTYSQGRVFCGGDAVHRHPPSSGLGSNTSIQDGFNLAWKLAYVVQGLAAPSLLESYTPERAPVGKQVVARANQSRVDYGPINACFRTAGESDPVAAGLAKLRDPSEAGVQVRDELRKAIEHKNTEFNAQGVELNQRYESNAVVADADGTDEVWRKDRELYLQATTRPGAKVPHAWLVGEDGRRISTLDVTGKQKFTLLTGLSGVAWKKAALELALPFLRLVVVGEKGALDLYGEWHRAREVHEAGAVLVRPDGYVAWREQRPIWDEHEATRSLRAVLGKLLGKTC